MKAYISRDTLVDIIKKHTVFSRAKDVPDNWKWYVFKRKDGSYWFLTWDFAVMDRILVDVEKAPDWVQPILTEKK